MNQQSSSDLDLLMKQEVQAPYNPLKSFTSQWGCTSD